MEFWEELLHQGFAGEYNPETGIFRYADSKDLREIVTAAAYRSLFDKAYLRIEWHIEAGKHRDAYFLLPKRKLPLPRHFHPAISGSICDDWLKQWGAQKDKLGSLMEHPPRLYGHNDSGRLLVYWRKAEHLPKLVERLAKNSRKH